MVLTDEEYEEAISQEEVDRYDQELDDDVDWYPPVSEGSSIKENIVLRADGFKIPYLVHFTKLKNLTGIMKHGLYPRSRLVEVGITHEISDQHRLDGNTDGTSLSIGFPNYKMFFSKLDADRSVEWVVLLLDRSVLWKMRCAFFPRNAASNQFRSHLREALMTPEAFASMYDEIVGKWSRSEQILKSYDPTDPQAEVVAFDVIQPKYIRGVAFQSEKARDMNQLVIGERLSIVRGALFSSRPYARKCDG
jgi:hypothetical protein